LPISANRDLSESDKHNRARAELMPRLSVIAKLPRAVFENRTDRMLTTQEKSGSRKLIHGAVICTTFA
jgi:hypothetical protein